MCPLIAAQTAARARAVTGSPYRRDDLAAVVGRSATQRRAAGPLVLVVDAAESARALLRSSLEQEGYRVSEAAGAHDGLEAFAGEASELVLRDVRVPELDGWELLQQVQRLHGRAAPVIMSSGVVDKPFAPQQPLEQARRILSR